MIKSKVVEPEPHHLHLRAPLIPSGKLRFGSQREQALSLGTVQAAEQGGVLCASPTAPDQAASTHSANTFTVAPRGGFLHHHREGVGEGRQKISQGKVSQRPTGRATKKSQTSRRPGRRGAYPHDTAASALRTLKRSLGTRERVVLQGTDNFLRCDRPALSSTLNLRTLGWNGVLCRLLTCVYARTLREHRQTI